MPAMRAGRELMLVRVATEVGDHPLAVDGAVGAPEKGRREAYFPEAGGYVATPVYDRYALRPEMTVTGPALIEENESTCVVGVGDTVRVDAAGNLVALIAREEGRA